MTDCVHEYSEKREKLQELLLSYADLPMKRLLSLDTQAYQDGALPKKTKELLGLVGSMVLRCDDCITHHLINCHDAGVTDEELTEALTIAMVVGGSITVPHQRRAYEKWDELKKGS